ncbi:uncharacterized protein LOC143020652 isoform X2 [Oratosquilla oratoria]|uniref:uncharacterized protein LOC143020652 isoform X2 n=1 Tax=Oratosquilla oratoria TaxID=337810 RepID=UPI003F7740F6
MPPKATGSPLQQLFDEFWAWRLRDSPQYTTYIGIHDYDDCLDDMSLSAYQGRYDKCLEFLSKAEAVEPNLRSDEDKINLLAFKENLKTYIEGFAFKGYLLPLNYTEGIHEDFEDLISWMVFETPQDYEKLLSRLRKLPVQIEQIIDLMRVGMKEGVVNHAVSMKGMGEAMERFLVHSAEDSPTFKPFFFFKKSFSLKEIEALRTKAKIIINKEVTPAFQRLRDFVKNEYVTRAKVAVTSLPNGERLYRQLIKFHTSTNMTVEEIHQMGLQEVTRIEGEIKKIVEELGYDMTVQSFSTMTKNDPKFAFNSVDDLMKAFDHVVDRIGPELPKIFFNVPKTMRIEGCRLQGSAAFYQPASLDGTRIGHFYVNTQRMDVHTKYNLMSLTLHEGSPGHHLQYAHSLQSSSIASFRKLTPYKNFGMAPSRFPMHTSFIEGWGLYAETLGFDMKLYDDPYDRYGHYSYELYRACRLVADTGIHALGWSPEDAAKYMFEKGALTRAEAQNEVDRYITWPGQALGYKIGQLHIFELREKARRSLGSNFDIRKFHDLVLNSCGPLEIMDREVGLWIAEEKELKNCT